MTDRGGPGRPRWLRAVAARPDEVAAARPGDEIVARPDVVMDRAFTVDAAPETVWPWLAQLGKQRAGWYLPRAAERFVPRSRRAVRHLDPAWTGLQAGDVIPDYGPDGSFEVALVDAPHTLVYRSQRGRMKLSWAITLNPVPAAGAGAILGGGGRTRVHLRLRLTPVRRRALAETGGGLMDLLTIAGMAAGLAERLRENDPAGSAPGRPGDQDRAPGGDGRG